MHEYVNIVILKVFLRMSKVLHFAYDYHMPQTILLIICSSHMPVTKEIDMDTHYETRLSHPR